MLGGRETTRAGEEFFHPSTLPHCGSDQASKHTHKRLFASIKMQIAASGQHFFTRVMAESYWPPLHFLFHPGMGALFTFLRALLYHLQSCVVEVGFCGTPPPHVYKIPLVSREHTGKLPPLALLDMKRVQEEELLVCLFLMQPPTCS